MKHTKIIIAIAAITLICVSAPFIAFLVLHFFILTPEKLTAQITKEINEQTNIRFECESIELDYLDSWPSISLTINGGKLGIPEIAPEDSVSNILHATFAKASGTIQLLKLLKEHTLCIENVFVTHPDIHLELGRKLPPLLKDNRKSQEEKILFDISRINIADANVCIIHKKKNIETEAEQLSVDIKGNLAAAQPVFEIETSCKTLRGKGKANLLGQDIAFSMQGKCEATKHFNDITLSDTRFFINQFPFEMSGSVNNLGKGETPAVDIQFALLASSLKELLDFIPPKYISQKDDYSITGRTALKGEVKGTLQGSSLPNIRLTGFIEQGSFYKKGIKQGIDTISLNLEVCHKQNTADSSYIALRNVKVKGLNSSIQMESRITNLQTSPFVTADMKGFIDFDRIGSEFISPELAVLKGNITSDLSVAFNLKDLQEGNLSKIWADGTLQAKHIEARSPKYNLDAFVSGLDMKVGYKKNKSDFIAQAEVLSGNADLDTLKIEYDKSVFLNLSKLHLRSNTSLSQSPNSATPVTLHLNCATFQAKLDKDTWASAEDMELHAGTKPSGEDKNKNEGGLIIAANTFKYLDSQQQTAVVMQKGKFITELRPASGKKEPASSSRKWDIKGMLDFEHSRIYSAYFPLMVNVSRARLGFQNNQLILSRMQMQAGKSDCILSGTLNTNPESPTGKSGLEGTLQVLSGSINYDELKQAFMYGEALSNNTNAPTVSSLTLGNMEQMLKPDGQVKAAEHPLYIPANVQLYVQLDVDNINFHEIDLQQVQGNILIKKQQAYMQLSTRTNVGKTNLTMLYDSRDKNQVKAYFDLDLKDMLVGQIPKVIPTVATMFPLATSMDGLIDCHLTAEGILDNQMLPIASSATAVCSLKGQNLVLIDNATFKEIAHKFKFKNKERNQIDQLSANLILQNSQIEVIPFLMEWDRYKAIIGGTHSTDFTYNYHLTMLKSPIPIDFGINLSGKTEKFNYKTGKCKYKDLFKDGGVKHQQQTEVHMEEMRRPILERMKL